MRASMAGCSFFEHTLTAVATLRYTDELIYVEEHGSDYEPAPSTWNEADYVPHVWTYPEESMWNVH